ncbi:recombinase family protein [Phormidium sp. LEGE 05292]|nr:recombinase family protein [Phormidium sp. LEGE 05292]
MAEIREIVVYARVSTVEQSQNSHALEQQIARLKSTGVELVLIDLESGREGKESELVSFLLLIYDNI